MENTYMIHKNRATFTWTIYRIIQQNRNDFLYQKLGVSKLLETNCIISPQIVPYTTSSAQEIIDINQTHYRLYSGIITIDVLIKLFEQ